MSSNNHVSEVSQDDHDQDGTPIQTSPSTANETAERPRKRSLQFSLSAIFFQMLVVAVGIGLWRYSNERRDYQERVTRAEVANQRLEDYLAGVNARHIKEEHHRDLLAVLEELASSQDASRLATKSVCGALAIDGVQTLDGRTHPDIGIKRAAIRALSSIGDETAAESLFVLLITDPNKPADHLKSADPDRKVRQEATGAYYGLDVEADPEVVVGLLIEQLLDPHVSNSTRRKTIKELGQRASVIPKDRTVFVADQLERSLKRHLDIQNRGLPVAQAEDVLVLTEALGAIGVKAASSRETLEQVALNVDGTTTYSGVTEHPQYRLAAVKALRQLGDPKCATTLLLLKLTDPNEAVRAEAANGYKELAVDVEDQVLATALEKRYADPKLGLPASRMVVEAFVSESLAPQAAARTAVNFLTILERHGIAGTEAGAIDVLAGINALNKLGPVALDGRDVLQTIILSLDGEHPQYREYRLAAINALRQLADKESAALLRMISETDEFDRVRRKADEAYDALSADRDDQTLVELLVSRSEDDGVNPVSKRLVIDALGKYGKNGDTEAAVLRITKFLEQRITVQQRHVSASYAEDVRKGITALGAIGRDAKAGRAILERIVLNLDGDDFQFRLAAINALRQLVDTESAVLLRMISETDQSDEVVQAAKDALESLGVDEDNQALVDLLVSRSMVKELNPASMRLVVQKLGELGASDPEDVVPAIVALLTARLTFVNHGFPAAHKDVVLAGINALEKIGNEAKAGREILETVVLHADCVSDGYQRTRLDPTCRRSALGALARLKDKDAAIFLYVVQRIDPDETVRTVAREQYKSLGIPADAASVGSELLEILQRPAELSNERRKATADALSALKMDVAPP